MKKTVFGILVVLCISVVQAQSFEVQEEDAGILPDNKLLWWLDRALDSVQHGGNATLIAQERLAEIKVELKRGNAQAVDEALGSLEEIRGFTKKQRDELSDKKKELEKEYNEKFDFDLGLIKERINAYLAVNDLRISQNVKVNIVGFRRQSFEVVVGENGLVFEIKNLLVESSPDALVSLSHGEVWAGLRTDASFKSLAKKIMAKIAIKKLGGGRK